MTPASEDTAVRADTAATGARPPGAGNSPRVNLSRKYRRWTITAALNTQYQRYGRVHVSSGWYREERGKPHPSYCPKWWQGS